MRTIAKPTTKPRGRKPKIDPVLEKNLKALKIGSWVVLDEFGKVTDESRQSSIGQSIRSTFKRLRPEGEKVTVSWSPEGDCQVVAKKAAK